MKLRVYEILEKVAKATTDDDRVTVLRKNAANDLKLVLRAAYHPKIRFGVDHVPKYRPLDVPPELAGNSIGLEMNRIYVFEPANPRRPKGLKAERQEEILIQILESLEKPEAAVFMNMLLKDLRVPGLDANIVRRAFPGLLDD